MQVPSEIGEPPEEPNISIDQHLQGTKNTISSKKSSVSMMQDKDDKVNMKYPLRMKSIEDEALTSLDE